MLTVILGLSISSIVFVKRSEAAVQGAVTMIAGSWLQFMVLLIACVTGASSLAHDRKKRFSTLILARGVTRAQYLLAKTVATLVSSSTVTLVGIGLFYLVAVLALPTGRWQFETVSYFPGPSPELFDASPLLNDLLSVGMILVAVSVLSLIGLFFSILLSSEYAAAVSPFIVFVAAAFALNSVEILSPLTYLDVWDVYPRTVPKEQRLYLAFFYWLSLGLVLMTASSIVFLRQEVE